MRNRKKKKLRAGIYARRTIDSETSDSIQMQVDACHKYLDLARPGEIESIVVYTDEGFTRRNTDRPDWERMMCDIEAKALDLICTYKIDRISGNMRDFALFYTKVVDDFDMQLISVREGIDSSLPLIGEVMAYISAMMSTYEVKQDSIRSFDNSRNLAVHGFWFGGKPPIGYTLLPVTVNGKIHKILEPAPEDVAYKENLVSIFLNKNLTLSGMEGYLRRSGIKTRNGKFFSTTQIYALLTAPQCVANTPEIYDYFEGLGCEMEQQYSSREKWDGKHGIIVFGRTTEQKGKHKVNPPEDWLVSIGLHKPIMTADMYLRIREQLDSHTYVKTCSHPPELLKGILRCKCGSIMRVSYKKKVDGSYSSWYYCLRRMRQGVEYCESRQIKTILLDNEVLKIFKQISADPKAIDKYINQDATRNSKTSASRLRNREKILQDKIGNLVAALSKNSESSASKYIIEEMEHLDQELKECRQQILFSAAEERKAIFAKKDIQKKREEICSFIQNFEQFTMHEKNEIVRNVLKECIWDGEVLKIVL
ncbi:recombinase family protein [Diplocloster hominis]|uniref:recombinase family protein n=1 Tax=Diplocloster hominis TaxID=3079010 RepID=UPI0031BA9887